MILVYIENKDLLKYIVNILDYTKYTYTTDNNLKYDYLLIGEVNSKTVKLVQNNILSNIKIIFVTYLEENRIDKNFNKINKISNNYNMNLKYILSKSYKVIASFSYYKAILGKKITVIPFINEYINRKLSFSYLKNINKKTILIIDTDYNHIKTSFSLIQEYPNNDFIYLGYKAYYNLNKKEKEVFNLNYTNVKFIKNYSKEELLYLLSKVRMAVCFDNDLIIINRLILLKINFMLYKTKKWNSEFINNKNIYLFNDTNINSIFEKILFCKLGNITSNTLDVIVSNTFDNIVDKFNRYLI